MPARVHVRIESERRLACQYNHKRVVNNTEDGVGREGDAGGLREARGRDEVADAVGRGYGGGHRSDLEREEHRERGARKQEGGLLGVFHGL